MNIEVFNELDKVDRVIEFVSTISDYPCDTLKDEITSAVRHKDDFVLLAENGGICGVFAFYVDKQDSYIELTHAFSTDKAAYDEMFSYLSTEFKGYQLDVVIKSKNSILEQKLKSLNAKFFPQQIKMKLKYFIEFVNDYKVVPYDEKYRDDYLSMHSVDVYWTGERVLKNLDIFKVYLALDGNEVVGYLDITYKFEEVEPYDVFVKKEYRNKGYGKALLSKAMREIAPDNMVAFVDVDDHCAQRLFFEVGLFRQPEFIQTVSLRL